MVFILGYGDHTDQHVLTHSFPTLRSSDLKNITRSRYCGASPSPTGSCPSASAGRTTTAISASSAAGAFRTTMRSDPIRAVSAFTRARSEEHTSELQSLMRISYDVFCMKKKTLLHYINIIFNFILNQ